LHVGNAGTLQHRMRQQEVGHLGAFIEGHDCDDRPLGAARFQSLDESLRLAFGDRRIGLCRRPRNTRPAAFQRKRSD
jgi:hypothetical protein